MVVSPFIRLTAPWSKISNDENKLFCKRIWSMVAIPDTAFSDIALSITVPPSCLLLQALYIIGLVRKNGEFYRFLHGIVWDEWLYSSIIIWVIAVLFYADTVWRVWGVLDLSHSVAPHKDTNLYLEAFNGEVTGEKTGGERRG